MNCPICLSEVTDQYVMKCCKQSFCYLCISTWKEENTKCPLCREEITNEEKCRGLTKNGIRCKKNALDGSDKCHIHMLSANLTALQRKKEKLIEIQTILASLPSDEETQEASDVLPETVPSSSGLDENHQKRLKDKCCALTKKGIRCKKNALDNDDKCHIHCSVDCVVGSVVRLQCCSLTKKGIRCKNKARENETMCHVHK